MLRDMGSACRATRKSPSVVNTRTDGGGSNGCRIRAWKIELAKLAAQTGLAITVCHLPPGTSKWNWIEHRLFSQVTMIWRGRPLIIHQVIVDLIGATTTSTGLSVHCVLDTDHYPTGLRYEPADVEALSVTATTSTANGLNRPPHRHAVTSGHYFFASP